MKTSRKPYETDLTDAQWEAIAPLFTNMRTYKWPKRELTNAVLYLNKTGCQWRNLPHDFPPHFTVSSFYRRARINGLWDKILQRLVALTRENAGRQPCPSYGIVDSQSVKTVDSSDERGIDGGKKVKGRKRHIVVDTMGNLLSVIVHAANIHDTMGGLFPALWTLQHYPGIKGFSADAGYRGTFVEEMDENFGKHVEISEKIAPKVWQTQPKRWVVERTFAWMNAYRRLSKDFEISTDSAEAMVKISHMQTLLKRL